MDHRGTAQARTVLVHCGVAVLLLCCGGRTPSEVGTVDGPETGDGPDGGEVPVPPGCEVVHFKSPIVELVIRWEVDIPEGPIPGAAVTGIEELYTGPEPVESLVGVECLVSLRGIRILRGTITSLEPLAPLEHLRGIRIDENAVTDLSPLSGKQHLVALSFWNNQIESLAGLVLPQPPEDQRCGGGIELGGNPIPESEVRPFCEQGWEVTWGISDSEATPPGHCNLDPCPP